MRSATVYIGIFLAISSGLATPTFAADNKKVERVMDAIRNADKASVMLVYALTSCDRADPPMTRDLLVIHRDMVISSMSKIFRDRNKALTRYDDIKKIAASSEKRTDGKLCIDLLDELQHELDIAIARLDEAYK